MILIVSIIGLFNFKEVVKSGIEIVTDLQEEIHNDKLVKRDELMGELLPLLSEFRGGYVLLIESYTLNITTLKKIWWVFLLSIWILCCSVIVMVWLL